MEEDSEEGIHELVVARIGVSNDFKELDYTHQKAKCYYDNDNQWRQQLNLFQARVNRMWAALGFNCYVPGPVANSVMTSFNFCPLFRPRKESDLEYFADF